MQKFALAVSPADLRALALLAFNTPPPVKLPAKKAAARDRLPEGAKAFLGDVEKEVAAARTHVHNAPVSHKMRLALLAIMQLVVVVGTQNTGKLMHVLCPCIGPSWATDHKHLLQPYELSSVAILLRSMVAPPE